jgi:hypothetical protein
MEPQSASPGLTRWIVLAAAFISVAIVLLLRGGQPDGGDAQAPSDSGAITDEDANAVLEVAEAVDDRSGDPKAEPQQIALPVSELAPRIGGFLALRDVSLGPALREALDAFAAEPRDPSWASGMEARFQSELAQPTVMLAESYVECRRSRCIALLIRPPGAQQQLEGLRLLGREAGAEQARLAQALGLLGGPIFLAAARDGALVHWHAFHRRCGPEWKCLE